MDNMVIARVLGDKRLHDTVLEAKRSARAKFYRCHLTEDELMGMPPEEAEKFRALRQAMGELSDDVPAIGVFGISKLDRTVFADEESAGVYEALRSKPGPNALRKARDAVHVATANLHPCDYFVTEDVRLRRHTNRLGLKMKAIDLREMARILEGHG